MAKAIDITWHETADNALIGELGGLHGEIRNHPVIRGVEARIATSATSLGEPYTARDLRDAMMWVERQLLRLANGR